MSSGSATSTMFQLGPVRSRQQGSAFMGQRTAGPGKLCCSTLNCRPRLRCLPVAPSLRRLSIACRFNNQLDQVHYRAFVDGASARFQVTHLDSRTESRLQGLWQAERDVPDVRLLNQITLNASSPANAPQKAPEVEQVSCGRLLVEQLCLCWWVWANYARSSPAGELQLAGSMVSYSSSW